MSYHEGVAKEVDALEQIAEWRWQIQSCKSWIALRAQDKNDQELVDALEYALFYNPEEKVKALQDQLRLANIDAVNEAARANDAEGKIKELNILLDKASDYFVETGPAADFYFQIKAALKGE